MFVKSVTWSSIQLIINYFHVVKLSKYRQYFTLESNLEDDAFIEIVKYNVKKLIIKEKNIMIEKNQYKSFNNKWKAFLPIYDFMGPDPQI